MTQKTSGQITNSKIVQLYTAMLRIRRFEEKIVKLYPKQEMKTPVHLYIGQEAIAAGVCCTLTKKDYVFGTHRGHGLYIAKGGSLADLAAELYCKAAGCSKGKGGSMHLVDVKHSVCGSTAIVGGNLPLAVGAGLAISLNKGTQVSCAFFGDGAVDEGTFYESVNFASLKKLPVVFVCENNFYATNSHISKRQPIDNIYTKGVPFGVPGVRVDGNDCIEVYRTARQAVERARAGEGPTLIECRTYRWKTHVGPETDEDLGNSPQRDLPKWIKRCPIKKLRAYITDKHLMSKRNEQALIRKIDKEVEEAFRYARHSPLPKGEDLLTDLFGS